MRGYNGNLALAVDEVRIQRGIKGLLVRKRSSADKRIPFTGIREVWFQSSSGRWGWPGYILLVDRSGSPPDDFVARVRDDRAVTFLKKTDEWRSLAEAIASQSGAPLREFPPERRRGHEVVGSVTGDRQLRL